MKNKRTIKNFIKFISILIVICSVFFIRFSHLHKSKELSECGLVFSKTFFIESNLKAKIDKILVKEKDFIKAGDALVKFDSDVLDAKIDHIEKKIAFEKEKTNYLKFKEEKALEAYLNLKKEKSPDLNEIEEKLKNLESMQLNQKIQKSKIDILISEEDYLKTLKKHTIIYCPCDGCVNNIVSVDNCYVNVGDRLLSIAADDQSYAIFKIGKNKSSRYKINDLVNVSIDNYPMTTFQGKIVDIKDLACDNFIEYKVFLNQIKKTADEQKLLLTSNMRAQIIHE
ncbi:MAG: efflux RND transporter periplasmic adaptor subunit [Parachlamydiales bacterium]|jgi:multidrug resistance efflux pump